MFLSGQEILHHGHQLFPDEFDSKLINEASYDIRLGKDVFLSDQKVPLRLSEDEPVLVLPAGEFALLTSLERVAIPATLIGFITIRLKFKLQGLINVSGFHVDPTYEGPLIFSVQNVGPNDIRIYLQEPVFTIFFAEVKGALPDVVKQRAPRRGYDRISGELMSQLGGGSVTLSTVKRDLEKLEHTVKIYAPVIVALFLTIIGLLLRKAVGG